MEILTVGERIILYRKRRKITKKELSELAGVSVSAITKYENDESIPDPDTQSSLAVALNMSVNKLMYGFEDPAKNTSPKPLINKKENLP